MHSMCAPRVTRKMSRWYSHSRQTLTSMSCLTFPIAVLMRFCNSGSVFGSGGTSRTMFMSHHFQTHYQNWESSSTPPSGTSHKTYLRGFDGNGSITWTSAVSHEGCTSNAFKVTMKLQTFLFQMVVTSCNSVQYLWKYGFAKFSDNSYAPCISAICGNASELRMKQKWQLSNMSKTE